jgi:YidC/Oxa1 family membrane protein insertase
MFKAIKSDIHFFCTSVFDEKYISSTIEICVKSGFLVSLSIINLESKNLKQIRGKYSDSVGVYKHEKVTRPIETKLVITPSSSVTRNMAKILEKTPMIHMPHSVASLLAIYPANAFDEYDYLFACGRHHVNEYIEIKQHRQLNGEVLPVGYGHMDNLINAKNKKRHCGEQNTINRILIAPSWSDRSFLDDIGIELVLKLIQQNYHVTLRPHPLYMSNRHLIRKFIKLESKNSNFVIEDPFKVSISEILIADILIGDYSGISFEFARLNNKPVISLNTNFKALNPGWKNYMNLPIELNHRESIGIIVKSEVDVIVKVISELKFKELPTGFSQENLNHIFINGSPKVADNALYFIKRILAE